MAEPWKCPCGWANGGHLKRCWKCEKPRADDVKPWTLDEIEQELRALPNSGRVENDVAVIMDAIRAAIDAARGVHPGGAMRVSPKVAQMLGFGNGEGASAGAEPRALPADAERLLTEHEQEYIWIAALGLSGLKTPTARRTYEVLTGILRRYGWEVPTAIEGATR